jgi:metal-responsive CopG/Arc/MetJ family transcriptional regulator
LLGEMMAKTGKTQTYNDVVDALISQSVFMPAALLEKIDDAIKANKQLGYATREEFIEVAVVAMLQNLAGNHEKRSDKASKNQKIGRS